MMHPVLPFPSRRLGWALLLAALLPCCLACNRLYEVHWARNDFTNPSIRGFFYNRFYLASDAPSMRGETLKVEVMDPTETLDWTRCKLTRSVDWGEWKKVFENLLADRLHQLRVFADVCAAGDPYPILRPDLTLRVALTECDEGNAFLRYFPGFGLGATRLQWEGELVRNSARQGPNIRQYFPAGLKTQPRAAVPQTDTALRDDPRLFAFADVRLHPGGPMLFLSLKPWNGQALIAEDLHFGVDALVNDLRRLTGETRPPLGRFSPHPRSGPGRLPPRPAAAGPPAAGSRPRCNDGLRVWSSSFSL